MDTILLGFEDLEVVNLPLKISPFVPSSFPCSHQLFRQSKANGTKFQKKKKECMYVCMYPSGLMSVSFH